MMVIVSTANQENKVVNIQMDISKAATTCDHMRSHCNMHQGSVLRLTFQMPYKVDRARNTPTVGENAGYTTS